MKREVAPLAHGTFALNFHSDAAGKRQQPRYTHRGTKREAEARLRELLELSENGDFRRDKITLAEVALGSLLPANADCCDDLSSATLHESHREGGWLNATKMRVGRKTWLRYRQIVKEYLIPAFGALRVEKLRPAH
jgi:Phage integrase, N-terminal SAM-like domain